MYFKNLLVYNGIAIFATLFVPQATAQSVVAIGSGSIASAPPTYKAKTNVSGPGFNATAMLSRKIYVDEWQSVTEDGLQVPGRPIPTNDWWTDIINNQYSGALWSYPAMLRTSEDGIEINYPSYWADAGKELKSRSAITVTARDFKAASAIARNWHDWDVEFSMPNVGSEGEITVTTAHGMPFTWFEFSGLTPEIRFSANAQIFNKSKGYCGIKIGNDLYGIYFPDQSEAALDNENVFTFASSAPWVVVGLLRNESELDSFARYATSIPRDTRVDWSYDESSAQVTTQWKVTASNLREPDGIAPVLQGFLPHAYKYALPGAVFGFIDQQGIMTPRGIMKYGSSESGIFTYAYRFSGMLPAYCAPDESIDKSFDIDVLNKLLNDYSSRGSFGADTYWGGKGLVQMALNMSFARQCGNTEAYEQSKAGLRETFENWLTYTPGEDNFFFSYYPRWGAMLGFDVSYDSDAFNDHHFHFGYFTYAAALLCMEDPQFAEQYGDLLTLIAKDYANWDRTDKRFPFMRTLDPWCGHSWAGGLGDHGNDNGNGQESSSEAMQGWGGVYLLGVALNNKEMRDAGIWGWNTEARATREYWYDVDAPRSANAGGRKPWPGKADRRANYNYDEYPYAYNSNITGKGIGWWTWFGGDPLFMHGIQWMPISPALDYLSWDMDFADWAFDDMLSGANSTFSHAWFEPTVNTDNGELIEPLATNDWGNVALAYMQRFNPKGAAEIFDEALKRNMHIATSVSTSHISYFVTHNHLTYGDTDFTVYADLPTAQMAVRDGVATFFVYNPEDHDRKVNFYNSEGSIIKTVNAPARRLVGISADPVASSIIYETVGGNMIPPGESTVITAKVVDQYGALMTGKDITFSLSADAPASIYENRIQINPDARKGTEFTLAITCKDLIENVSLWVNDRSSVETCRIEGLPEICEVGSIIKPELIVNDQYGNLIHMEDIIWTATEKEATGKPEEVINLNSPCTISVAGIYKITATSASADVSASAELFVTPSMPLISEKADVAASSAENYGTLPNGAVDGDNNVRWGSNHTDNEWIMIDLGEDCYISRTSLLWEAAYGSHYEIQTAPEDAPVQTMTVTYAGTKNTITVPADDAWKTVADVRISAPGEKNTELNTTGRYVRMRGLERGTQYGYSLYEMKIFGLKSSTPQNSLIGIDFNLPETIDSGETVELSPTGYTRGGEKRNDIKVKWSADKEASFSGNCFTPESHGLYTIHAYLDGVGSGSGSVFVNETEQPVKIEFDSETYTAIVNHPAEISYTVMNQFLAPYTGYTGNMNFTLLDSANHPTESATFYADSHIFFSNTKDVYTIDFADFGSCKVNAVDMSEVNLALNKRTSSSSSRDDNKASKANDGNINTRWESDWAQPQYLTVDLGNDYEINRIKLVWEGAYAKSYLLQASADGENWQDFHIQNASSGGTEDISVNPIRTRYIRLYCKERALPAYGFSIYELEAYGKESNNYTFTDSVISDTDPENDLLYNLQGLPVTNPSIPGIYIRLTPQGVQKIMK